MHALNFLFFFLDKFRDLVVKELHRFPDFRLIRFFQIHAGKFFRINVQEFAEPFFPFGLNKLNLLTIIFLDILNRLLFLGLVGLGLAAALTALKDLRVHHHPFNPRRQRQRSIPNIGSLFAEDSAQQTLFGGKFFFAFGRNFTNQDIPGLNLGADADYPVFIEVL